MFFILSKTVAFLVKPTSLVFIFLILGLLFRKTRRRRLMLGLALSLLILFTNGMVSNSLMRLWELPATPFADLGPPYAVGIVLSGITQKVPHMPQDRTYFAHGADRAIHALELYKQGHIKKILISGGNGKLLERDYIEAEHIKDFFLLAGVPERDIWTEGQSRNTHENAAFSKELLEKNGAGGPFLLITSAFHMRRARACFQKEGLPIHTFSTDFYSTQASIAPAYWLIPSQTALQQWHILFQETVGIMAYKVQGYI